MTTKTALVAAAVATLVATGLAACGSSSNGGGGAKGGGTLTIQGDAGNPTLVENFNPFLATGHKFTDPKTLDFTIRQNVKWSDGQPFTAADVLFTFNLIKKYP